MTITHSHRLFIAGAVALAGAALYFSSAVYADARTTSNRATVDRACVSAAVETRETALADAWDTLHEDVAEALESRKSALVAAWLVENNVERGKTIKKAWSEWKTDKKEAQAEFRADRKAAWEAFNKKAKDECKTTLPNDERLEKGQSDSVSI